MAVHLSKFAVGCDSPASLEAGEARWIISRADGQAAYRHRTRYLPKRHAEMIGGDSSLYWIVKHVFVCRQPIIDFELVGEGREGFVLIHLAPQIVPVLATPRRAHQGWRYLEPADAPPDSSTADGTGLVDMPAPMLAHLRGLGLV